jgi:hypothetical protein
MAVLPEEQRTPVPGGALPGPRPVLGGWTRMASLTMPGMTAPTSPAAPMGIGGGLGGQMLPMPGLAARLLTGRNLDSYRATPVALARR